MKKNLFKGISFTVGASLWWGIIGVIYFKFVSYASPLELTIHRTIWTALLLILTTSYYSKWKEFNKIIKHKINIFFLLLTGLLVSINWFTWLYAVSTNKESIEDKKIRTEKESVQQEKIGKLFPKKK